MELLTTRVRCKLTIVKLDPAVLVVPFFSRGVGEDAAGMEAHDLHIFGLGVLGDLLDEQRGRVLGEAIRWPVWSHGRPHVGCNGRHIYEKLL